MKEKGFSKIVRDLITREGGHVSMVEAHQSCPGIPDLSYCIHGVEGFIELKAGKDAELRPGQIKWIKDRTKAGGRVCILWLNDETVYRVMPRRLYDRDWKVAKHREALLVELNIPFITSD